MPTFVAPKLLQQMKTNTQQSIYDISMEKPVFMVFLRHFGCVFCKEALADLAQKQENIRQQGIELVLVHMGTKEVADQYFEAFGLDTPQHVSDPDRFFYYEFGLRKGSFSQLYGLKTWFRGFSSETRDYKLELAKHLGDSTQMPGIFLVQHGEIIEEFIHKYASDRPDYNKLIACCQTPQK